MLRPIRQFTLLAVLFSSCANDGAGTSEEPPTEWTHVFPSPFAESNMFDSEFRYWFTRVVDAHTGKPIEGATLYSVAEHDYPIKRLAKTNGSAASGSFGLVRLDVGERRGDWAYVEAPGYAPQAEIHMPEFPVELVPGRDVTIRLFDPLGRPVQGAKAQYYLGCGHTPNSREPRTDATGRAVLHCIDPTEGFLFPVGRGIGGSDIDLASIPEFDGVRAIYVHPGGIVRGRIEDETGRPVSGAYVGADSWNHGPWTRTNHQGQFELVGAERYSELHVHRSLDDDTLLASVTAPPPGVPIIIRIGVAAEPTYRVSMLLRKPIEKLCPDPEVEVWAVRRSDGRSLVFESNLGGKAELELPAGIWELRIAGEVGPFVHTRRTIDAAKAAAEQIEIQLALWPAVAVAGMSKDRDVSVAVASANEERWISDKEQARGVIYLPRDREIALRVSAGDSMRAGFPGCSIRIPRGTAALAKLTLPAPPSNVRGDRTILARKGTLRVLDPDGTPLEDALVFVNFRHRTSEEDYTDKNGEVPAGPVGARVEVQAEHATERWIVLRTTLRGEIPWTIQFGSASVTIEVRDENGAKILWFGVLPDGDDVYDVPDDIALFGFRAGVYRMLIAAEGRKAVMQQFALRNGEHRVLRVTLPNGP